MNRAIAACALFTMCLTTTSCNSVGPRAIRGARQSYNESVVQTWNEQLLLNLVRLRYRETPYFLQVGSITTQYSLQGNLGLQALVDPFGPGDDEAQAALGIGLSEQPTVTYSPLRGSDFVRQLMSPISLDSLVLLSSAGWSIERVLRLTVNRMNTLWNAPSASGPTPGRVPEYTEFTKTARALRALQDQRALYLEVAKRDDSFALELLLDPSSVDPDNASRIRQSLGLDPSTNSYDIEAYAGESEGAVLLLTRSLLGVMYFLSQGVEVPGMHRQEGRVTVTVDESGAPFDWGNLLGDLIVISSSRGVPDRAFVSVYHRGHWFYIDDADLPSKSTFGLLAQLFNLQSGNTSQASPLLTIPVGG